MGDKQIGDPLLILEIFQKIDDLRLNGYIQRRNRLVTDYQIRLQNQRTRNPNPLPLSAGKLMGITVGMFFRKPHPLKHRIYQLIRLFFLSHNSVSDQRFCNNIPHRHSRIQGSVRILEDHLHLFAKRFQFLLLHIRNIGSVQKNLTVCHVIHTDNGSCTA